ncbi:MAG: dihydroorotase [Phycisphaerales bacterium]|nr:MAG: dihydroorotase [Phycisphaerales bacterium]
MKFEDHGSIVLRGGRVIDPAAGRDEIADVAIVDGRIAEDASGGAFALDASGCVVCPGLMDIHVHLREPGFTHKETIETGTRAAAAGGFTYVACMPNTNPPLDHPDIVRLVMEKAERVGHCLVGPVAAITEGRCGRKVVEMAALKRAGAVAFSDDGDGVEDDEVMREAFVRAQELGAVLIQHCEDRGLAAGGVMHLGAVSRRMGLPGIDPRAEEAMIERDLQLCRETGARYHVAHVSTAKAVQLVREAKAEGLPVTTEVCTHHLALTDEACVEKDPNTKMHPPLRTEGDVAACRRGLVDGTIDCIVTDHAPHAADEKARGFLEAPPGIVGLETAVGLAAYTMIESGSADWRQVVEWLTTGPARVLGLPTPSLRVGSEAAVTVIDPDVEWTVDPERFQSKGRNTPFSGWKLKGRAVATVIGRRVCRALE